MRFWFLYSICFFFHLNAVGQKNEYNLSYGFGPSYFFNDNSTNRRVDRSSSFGFNVVFSKSKRPIYFNPSIFLMRSDYHCRLSYNGLAHVLQKSIGLNLDALMRLQKHIQLRVGIYLLHVNTSLISLGYEDNSYGNYYYGNGDMYKTYAPKNYQAGAVAGLSFPFKLKRRQIKFGFVFHQSGTSIVNNDYYNNNTIDGENVKVLSVKARPTKCLFTFEIGLTRDKRKKLEED